MTWEPAERVQKNAAGEYRALIGGEWIPVAKAQKNASGVYRVDRGDSAQVQATTQPERSTIDQLGRQAGLTARYGIEGLGDVVGIVQNPLSVITGGAIPRAQDVYPELATRIGLPQPETEREKLVGAASRGVVGAGTMVGAGGSVAQVPGLVGQAGKVLAAQPAAQIASSAGGAGGAELARQEGAGPGGQLAAGLVGGIAGGLAGQKISEKASSYLANKLAKTRTFYADDVDESINVALKDTGQSIADLPPNYADQLRKQVQDSLVAGNKLDIPAALRAKEFKSVGIQPTLGQVTRDPMQYATERNLRGVAGVGEPLLERFSGQETNLRGQIGQFAKGAADRYQAGGQIGEALSSIDRSMSQQVSNLYKQARQSAGKDLELPVQGIAQDYANILRDFGDKIPSGVRNNFEDLGLLTGKQNKLFTVEEADRLLKVINANQSNDPAVNSALTALRNSVKGAVTEIDATGGVYAPAVKAAADRFKMHDMLPALQSAAKGELDADKFVSRHIVGAKPEAVKEMAKLLNATDKEAFQQARLQVGEYLRRSAYGINEAGDAGFRPAGFSKALDSMGERLKAFYTPDEVSQLKQLSRVGSYMYSFPAQAAVSTSSSGVPVQNALMSILSAKVPFLGTGVDIAKGAIKGTQQRGAVRSAMEARIPETSLSKLAMMPDENWYNNTLRSLMYGSMGANQ